jgi:hypothetical protein
MQKAVARRSSVTTEEGCLETRDEATNTRLEEIRRIFGRFEGARCLCEHCVAGRELLAVVEAELIGGTPQQIAKGYYEMAAQRHLAKWRRERSTQRADAWKALA